MQLDDFWALVEGARADCAGQGQWPTGSQVGAALAKRLEHLPLDQIMAFEGLLSSTVQRAHTWEACAACFLISGYLSDDGFTDFKAGLVGLGRDTFDRVVTEPDSLADLPVVDAIATGTAEPFLLHGEQIHLAPASAYEARTGDSEAFWEAMQDSANYSEVAADQRADAWSGTFGSDDRPAIPARLPRLHARFPRSQASSQPGE